MSRTTITTGDESYIGSVDDPVPREGRLRAFIVGQAIDGVTKQLLPVPVHVTVDESGFTVEVKDDNWFVIAGVLRQQFPLLATQPYSVSLKLSAPGYKQLKVIATVPQTPPGKLPKELAPADTEMLKP